MSHMGIGIPTISFHRRRLPHWLVADHAYFVTLCRKGCLPSCVVMDLRKERDEFVARNVTDRANVGLETGGRSDTSRPTGVLRSEVARDVPDRAENCVTWNAHRLAEERRHFLKIDAILDATAKSRRDLCISEVSSIVIGNLDWLRAHGWRIWAATLMPSHMHLVLRNIEGRSDALRSDLALFMSWTARQANVALGMHGSFWQPEPFDHWCRDANGWRRSVCYTLNNPVKAGLCARWCEWPHTVVDPEVKALLDR